MATLPLSDAILYYKLEGHGSPLLLIHGTMPDADGWGELPAKLARHYQVISYDRRGFSRSSGEMGKDFDQHARDAAALLRALVQEPAIVVGWSWGGLVALELAAAYPELVRRMVLIEPAYHLKKHMTLNLFKAIGSVQLQQRFSSKERAVETFFRWAFGYQEGGNCFDEKCEFIYPTVAANAKAILKEIDAGTGEGLLPNRIAAIDCPVQVICGGSSQPEFIQASQRVKKMLPHAYLETIPGASHAMHIDSLDELELMLAGEVALA